MSVYETIYHKWEQTLEDKNFEVKYALDTYIITKKAMPYKIEKWVKAAIRDKRSDSLSEPMTFLFDEPISSLFEAVEIMTTKTIRAVLNLK